MNDSRAFFDTNAIVYLYSSDEPEKQKKAFLALQSYDCVISRQVINEFCNVNIKKKKLPVAQLKSVLRNIKSLFRLIPVEDETVLYAIAIHERYGYSFYDSLIIASNCKYLFTEDLQDGQIIDGLIIINIFQDKTDEQ
jgi:predicted nucleic acid-binding protein